LEEPSKTPPVPPGPLGGYWRIVVIGVLLAGAILFGQVPGGSRFGPVRAAFTLSFLDVAPGLAVMGLLRLDDLLLELSLAVAVSLALGTIVAMGMLLLKDWVPSTGLTLLAVFTAIGAIAQAGQVQRLKTRNPYRQAPAE